MTATQERDDFLEHFLPGANPATKQLRAKIGLFNRRYKNPPHMGRSLLLVGESGVGKNHVARVMAAHLWWLRDRGRWEPPRPGGRTPGLSELSVEYFAEVAVPNLPSELIESELFGHVKGAFTGAVNSKAGYFGTSEISDLLLDEIGDASPTLQAKLLQVLNDGTFKAVGASPSEVTRTEARVFLATNRDLDSLVQEGKFREDLYWRIGELVLRLPPLREQAERIPALAQSLVAEILSLHEASGVELTLTQADLRWAQSQAWPGNVRELRRTVWRWAYEEGRVPLADIHMEYRSVGSGLRPETPSVKALVRQRLALALESKKPLASSVGEFVGEFDVEIKRELYALKNEMELNRRTLGALFGDGTRAAKQISAWGKGVRSS